MTDNKILDKIKKLLALSASDQPGEAASALAKAQALMAEHNLSETDVSLSEITHDVLSSRVSVSQPKEWEVYLTNLLKRAFGVQITLQLSHSRRHDPLMKFIIVGPKGQLAVAKHTLIVLQRGCLKARVNFVQGLPGGFNRSEVAKAAEAFCLGWVMAVDKMVMDYAGVDHSQAVTLYHDKLVGKTTEVQADRRSKGLEGAMFLGMAEGASQKLYRPMDEQGNDVKQLAGV